MSAKTPLLSVFIPLYNGEKYVREAIESVLDNGFADLEVIVVDDGSNDGTVQVVEAIRHPALRLYRNAANLGVVTTRDRSVSLLNGRYMALLDQDDIAVAGRFEQQVARLEAADGPDIIGGAVEFFGDEEGQYFLPSGDAKIKAALLFFVCPLANPTICMKLAPLREGRIRYTTDIGVAADYAMWVDAMRVGMRFENLPVVLTRYRRHGDAMTSKLSVECAASGRRVRQKVVDMFFPAMSAGERAALLDALSTNLSGGPRWLDGVYAVSHAAMLAKDIAGIDTAWLIKALENMVVSMIERALKLGNADNETLEMMIETSAHFERWRAANAGALDARIMALIK
ncbi:MAG: glycosyltransferase family 2 protein [Proteobacteria bacterium]|nr:glycosyltransferase family 2 protein [Pseudomonadota bacterium]NBY37850.1 glycosyltransferase family 2 protein [Verrucomicrobiota bacterium]